MFFSELNPKEKSFLTEGSYTDYLASYVVGIFEYSDDIPVSKYALRLLDLNLLQSGKAALFWSDVWGKWITGRVSFNGGTLNPYGMLPDCSCFDRAGNEHTFKEWENNDKCFVFFNDRSHNPDINIQRYADLLAKLDISLNANIVNSRMFPIVLTEDSNEATQIREGLQHSEDGATKVITSKNGISLLTGTEGAKVLNITDVNASDKIQYLNHAHDDLVRRFLAIYGININGTGKLAQQSRDEINGSDNAALVIPFEMLKSREDTWKRFREVTGINARVKLSTAWEREDISADAQSRKESAEADKLEAEKEQIKDAENFPGDDLAADKEQEQGEEVNA